MEPRFVPILGEWLTRDAEHREVGLRLWYELHVIAVVEEAHDIQALLIAGKQRADNLVNFSLHLPDPARPKRFLAHSNEEAIVKANRRLAKIRPAPVPVA